MLLINHTQQFQQLIGKVYEKGYTISSLSEKMGIARTTLSRYFDNPKELTMGNFGRIVRTLKLTTAEQKVLITSMTDWIAEQ
jgi:AraC-like DNA-binding protein